MLKEFAKAKINLSLEILGKRTDGYHELRSLVAFADIGDKLQLGENAEPGLSITGPHAANLEGKNLIEVAVTYLKSKFPDLAPGHFYLEKLLPVASGIGGGSADAAAALRLMALQLDIEVNTLNKADIAKSLGADVPVCLDQDAVFMTGIGEHLTKLHSFPKIPCVLINPAVQISTGQIFQKLNAPPVQNTASTIQLPDHFENIDQLIQYMKLHKNDLQPVAEQIEPAVKSVLEELSSLDRCLIARMSGSGATCFGLFDDITVAQSAASDIEKRYQNWWVQSGTLG